MTSTSKVKLPNGTSVTVVNLDTIDYGLLESGSVSEREKLTRAASDSGFFNLDLRRSSVSAQTLDLLPIFLSQAERFFKEPRELKEKYARLDNLPFQARGYTVSEVDENYEICYDEFLDKKVNVPAIMKEDLPALASFLDACHTVGLVTLRCLSRALGLELDDHHRQGERSDSGLDFVYEPAVERVADVKENLHTDYGTLTLGFVQDYWGCHIKLRGTETWGFAEPKKGCVLVNVCDALDRLSGGVLHSATHRVTQPCDGVVDRHFLFYFLRPDRKLLDSWEDTEA